MQNISVAEILKIHGKWVLGKPFAEFVADKKRITERYAYILIKEAVNNHEILRLPLPNRTVLYGLPEFGPLKFKPSTEQKPSKEKLLVINKIEEDYVHGYINQAFDRLVLFADQTNLNPHPSFTYKEKMKQIEEKYGKSIVMFGPMISYRVKKDIIQQGLKQVATLNKNVNV